MSAYATILTGSQISCSFSQQGNLELTEEGKALSRYATYPCITVASVFSTVMCCTGL